jgi:signal transduction histidine kinase
VVRSELLHERKLADRFAVLKLVLAVTNFLVIGLDRTIPGTDSPREVMTALWVAGGFLIYMTISWMAIRAEWVSLRVYQRILPLTDVLAASMLIVATEGYLSPFNLWLAISVVSAGFGSTREIPVVTALLAVLAQIVIATIPQRLPLEPGIFFVRTAYLFGFASLVASISSEIITQSKALAAIARFGHDLASTYSVGDAVNLFESSLRAELGVQAVEARLGHEVPSGWLPLLNGATTIGAVSITAERPLSVADQNLVNLFADRLGAALRRIQLGQELIAAAAREERQRYADELHDTHLQTLAAVDMQAEAASRKAKDSPAVEDLKTIKAIVREAAAKTRQFISGIDEQPQGGPAVIEQVFRDRWEGAEVSIDSHIDLTEGQWRAVRMLVQEGLNNARIHAKAEKVWFTLKHHDGKVVASLIADGQSPSAHPSYGYGLARLQTVVQANRGDVRLSPREEGGSELTASFERKDI